MTSHQHPTIGETGEKPLAETVFLGVRSGKLRMDGRGAQGTRLPGKRAEIMPNALAEAPSSESVAADSQTLAEPSEALAGLCQRVAILEALSERVTSLEARLARKRPASNGRTVPRMTRPDRCPYGWRPHPQNPAVLIQDPLEQKAILAMIEARQNPALSLRGLCHYLDLHGHKRRGGKPWAGAHSLVRDILKRHAAETPADAKARVLERIAAAQARAAIN